MKIDIKMSFDYLASKHNRFLFCETKSLQRA